MKKYFIGLALLLLVSLISRCIPVMRMSGGHTFKIRENVICNFDKINASWVKLNLDYKLIEASDYSGKEVYIKDIMVDSTLSDLRVFLIEKKRDKLLIDEIVVTQQRVVIGHKKSIAKSLHKEVIPYLFVNCLER